MGHKIRKSPLTALTENIRAYALSLPEAYEEFPWGESVAKVNKKVFVFLGVIRDDDTYGFAVKLPASAQDVLQLPFAKPTGYGLGKSGWVSITLTPEYQPPIDIIAEWIDESYRAVAPKSLLKPR